MIATTITPTKNGDRPMSSDASVIEPTRISDITPTAMPAIASMITARRTLQGSGPSSSSSAPCGLKRSAWVRSEKRRPTRYVNRSTTATAIDMVSRSLENCLDSSVGPGRPPPSTSWNTAGSTSATTASSSMPAWVLAAVRSNVCVLYLSPPTSIAAPMTSRMLPRIEPISDALTTSCSPSWRAKKAMISSGALPNVTLRNPPMPGPSGPRAGRSPCP